MMHIINVFISKNNIQNIVLARLEKLKHMITKSSSTYLYNNIPISIIVGIKYFFISLSKYLNK